MLGVSALGALPDSGRRPNSALFLGLGLPDGYDMDNTSNERAEVWMSVDGASFTLVSPPDISGSPLTCPAIGPSGTTDLFGSGVQTILVIPGTYPDCNGNGIPDLQDIASNTSQDQQIEDGIPDECETTSDPTLDCDGDGVLDVYDENVHRVVYGAPARAVCLTACCWWGDAWYDADSDCDVDMDDFRCTAAMLYGLPRVAHHV